MGDPSSLARLADAVADGTPVDWDQMQAGLGDGDRPVVEQLRLLAAISTLHRTTEPNDTVAAEFPATAGEDSRTWGSLLILGELGRGGQGRVYRAVDTRLQREVALKVVRVARDATAAAHLLGEARLLARVRHPNVVTVYGADRVGDELGLWMELVKGQTLASRVARDGPFSAEEAGVIGASLCRALAAVHQAGLLHRDVKAQNVMREAGGRVVLMDFGAGRDLQDTSTGRRALGTPVYLPPEVLSGGPASVQSDIYSVGVLLFFLTTKRFPVSAQSMLELKERHERGQAALLRDLRPDLPESFVAVVARATDPNPDQRFESAGRLEEALTRATAGSALEVLVPTDVRSIEQRRPGIRPRAAIAAAVVAAALILAVAGASLWPHVFPGPAETPSIAVLPLRNLSGDAAKEYLADSLTDVLITHLTKIKEVRVLSFPAVASLKGQSKTPTEMGTALGVRYLLAGAIALEGPSIRTTVQLIDAKSGTTLWAEEYKREPSGLLEQQGEIVATVAARLKVDLTEDALGRLRQRRAASSEAQDSYLRGLAEISRRVAPTSAVAVQYLEQAVARDPSFAEAWAALSVTRVALANQVPGSQREELYSRARSEAVRALQLDPETGKAYAALGSIRFYHDWDWDGAETAFKRAVELTPGDSLAHTRYSTFLAGAQRLDEAIVVGQTGQAIEPISAATTASLGNVYYYARRYGDAIREFDRALQLSAGFAPAHYGLCRTDVAMQQYDRAIEQCRLTIAGGNRLSGSVELARAYALSGHAVDARRTLDEIKALPQAQYMNSDSLANVYAALGEYDTAFELLEEALSRKAPNLLWIRVDPRFDALRADQRFAAVVRRVGGVAR